MSIDELRERAEAYFAECEQKKVKASIGQMASFMGCSRSVFRPINNPKGKLQRCQVAQKLVDEFNKKHPDFILNCVYVNNERRRAKVLESFTTASKQYFAECLEKYEWPKASRLSIKMGHACDYLNKQANRYLLEQFNKLSSICMAKMEVKAYQEIAALRQELGRPPSMPECYKHLGLKEHQIIYSTAPRHRLWYAIKMARLGLYWDGSENAPVGNLKQTPRQTIPLTEEEMAALSSGPGRVRQFNEFISQREYYVAKQYARQYVQTFGKRNKAS